MKRIAVLVAIVASLAIVAAAAAYPAARTAPRTRACTIREVRWQPVTDAAQNRFWQMWTPASCGLSLPAYSWIFSGAHKNVLAGTDHSRFAMLPFVDGLAVTLVIQPLAGGRPTKCNFVIRPADPPLRMALRNCP